MQPALQRYNVTTLQRYKVTRLQRANWLSDGGPKWERLDAPSTLPIFFAKRWGAAAPVAQVCNLLYRRFVIGRRPLGHALRMQPGAAPLGWLAG